MIEYVCECPNACFPLSVRSIYRSQRIKLQHQLQSVLNNDHPVLLDMDSEHDQCKRDMDLQMDFRVTNADEMLRWEKATIDREHEVSFCLGTLCLLC